ncbi:MAG: amidohydrolase family protein [Chloroflexota bacterium]
MTTKLAHFIQNSPLCSTHEHLEYEQMYTENPPDILRNLFHNYVPADLVTAGASLDAVDALLDKDNPDIRGRFEGVKDAWDAVRHTGYGEAVQIIAKEIYGMDELTAQGLETAQAKSAALGQPGERLRILRDVANLDHVQTDHMKRPVPVETPGPDFFLYDINWANLCSGTPDLGTLADETGVAIFSLADLQDAMTATFAQHAERAVAVKSQHAYSRTLRWQERTDEEAAKALATWQRDPTAMTESERLCLGDWCWAKGVELSIDYNLPFKIHTGYYAGHSRMPVDYIKSGHLCPLLAKYLDAKFVLMHIAYPYSEELIALAKHYPNVSVDLCWAWSINPFSTGDFIRRYIHAAPANKLFVFGGDTHLPAATLAYSRQARNWFTRAMQAEVDEGLLTEAEAIALAERFMLKNQYAYFNLEEKKAILRDAT